MNDQLDARQLPGVRLVGPDQQRIGRISEVFLGGQTVSPQWVKVNMGLLGRSGSLVPLAGAELADGELHIPYGKDQIKDAPAVEAGGDRLTPSEEAALYRYYGLAAAYPYSAQDESRRWTQDADDRPHVVKSIPEAPGRPRVIGAAAESQRRRTPRHAAPGGAQDDAEHEADLYEAGELGTLAAGPARRGKHAL